MQENKELTYTTGHALQLPQTGNVYPDTSNCSAGTIYSILRLILSVPILLAIDSRYGDSILFGHGQWVANLMVFLGFIYTYRRRSKRVKKVMMIGMFVGLSLEFICSIVLGAYHYRFGNIPLWIAFGHGMIYASSSRLSRQRVMRRWKTTLQLLLAVFAASYCLLLLFKDNDWFGFLCGICFFLVLMYAKRSRFFFLIMFAIVAYIEQMGTLLGTWHWEPTAFGLTGGLPSGNPPSGVAVGYFVFEFAVLWIYLNLLNPKTKQRYIALAKAKA